MGAPVNIPPAALGARPAETDDRSKARLQKAVHEFESMFVGYMLKSMRAGISKDEMFGDSFGGDMLEGVFDMELARQMSKNSNFGVGEMLYRKITGEKLPHAAPHTGAAAKAPPPSAGPALPASMDPDLPRTPSPAELAAPAKPAPLDPGPVPVPHHAPAPVSPRLVHGGIVRRMEPLDPIIQDAAEQHGVSSSLLKAVIASESAGDARAKSPRNAKGLMQLVDSTAADMGVQNVWDPRQNIFGGAKYLQQMLERFGGNLEQALASYNAGPAAVEKHGGIPPYPETRAYISKVMNYLHYFEQQGSSGNDDE